MQSKGEVLSANDSSNNLTGWVVYKCEWAQRGRILSNSGEGRGVKTKVGMIIGREIDKLRLQHLIPTRILCVQDTA